jgi:hypothetical protein
MGAGAMLERALRDWPKARLICTGSADSIYDVGIADARRYIASA